MRRPAGGGASGYGLAGRDESTIENRRILAERHVLPPLGGRRLVDLSAEDVDAWLAEKARTLSTDTVHRLLSILRRSIRRAQGRDLVRRNVALLCEPPRGTAGRPSKSLTLDQANAILAAVAGTPMHAYVVLSVPGARTEELRALTWAHLDLDGDPPTIELWHSVRASGDTKTKRSRRTLELADHCVEVLRLHRHEQVQARVRAGGIWQDHDLVFLTEVGTELDAANVRRAFRRIVAAAGLDPPNMDATRAAAFLRVAAVQLWRADRGHLAPSRTLQHGGNREGLPEGTTPRADPRSTRDECPHLKDGAGGDSGWQLGCQRLRVRLSGLEPQWCNTLRLGVMLVGDTGFEPVTSSVSGKRATAALIARGGDGI